MSVREMEAITVGLEETMDEDMINQGPQFIAYMVKELQKRGVPVVTPAGGLGCHLNAMEFLDHLPQSQYPAGALASALYIAGGISRHGKRYFIGRKRRKRQRSFCQYGAFAFGPAAARFLPYPKSTMPLTVYSGSMKTAGW